jgi:hypothetical protein
VARRLSLTLDEGTGAIDMSCAWPYTGSFDTPAPQIRTGPRELAAQESRCAADSIFIHSLYTRCRTLPSLISVPTGRTAPGAFAPLPNDVFQPVTSLMTLSLKGAQQFSGSP